MREAKLKIERALKGLFESISRSPPVDSTEEVTWLDSDKRIRDKGYLLIFVLVVGFGSWAFLAPLESAAHARGEVQVKGNSQPVQHLEGGIVSEIVASNGDYVQVGDPLLRLDDVKERAELEIIEGRLWATRAKIDRLIAERDDLAEVIFTNTELTRDHRATLSADNERALFQARKADRLGEIEVLEQRIKQLETEIAGARAVLAAKKEVSLSLSQEISELEELLADGYVDKQRIRELNRSLAGTLGDVSDMEARISAAHVALLEARLQIVQLNKRFKTQVIDQLTEAQEQRYDYEERFRALSDRVDRMVIRSPAAGVVVGLKINTVGAVLAPRAELLTVVPDVEQLVISARLSPMDIDRIKVGQEAEVRFSVFKDAYTVTGSLVKVSADALLDEVTGETYFDATVELLEADLAFLGEYQLVPGMPAEVLVKTGTRTLMGYLTSPIRRVFSTSLIEE